MQTDFRQRMTHEHNELVDRIGKLKTFLWSSTFNSLKAQDRELLIEQLSHMKAYERVLAERITRL